MRATHTTQFNTNATVFLENRFNLIQIRNVLLLSPKPPSNNVLVLINEKIYRKTFLKTEKENFIFLQCRSIKRYINPKVSNSDHVWTIHSGGKGGLGRNDHT